jgi:3-methylcrotonyl-CoA carboxylase alpha subunit
VRVDTGVESGDRVSVFYDSMLAKLVVWGEDRATALRRISQSLAQVELSGFAHNVAFLRAAVEHPAFVAGDVHTGLLTEQRPQLLAQANAGFERLLLSAVVGRLCARATAAAAPSAVDPCSPWRDTRGFRLNAPARDRIELRCAEQRFVAELGFDGDETRIELADQVWRVRDASLTGAQLSFAVAGARQRASFVARDRGETAFVTYQGACLEVSFAGPDGTADAGAGSLGAVRSPLPGRIVSVFVSVGAHVKKGEPLVSLEAMKMEHTLHASVEGVVTDLNVAPREQVAEGSTLLVLKAPPQSDSKSARPGSRDEAAKE